MQSARIAAHVLRALAVQYNLDPRSIAREAANPGSVTGMAGIRARAALASLAVDPTGALALSSIPGARA